MNRLIRQTNAIPTGIIILLLTILFAVYKVRAAKMIVDQRINAQKEMALSCGPANATSSDDNLKNHPNNENGCPHQQGKNLLCHSPGCKRKSLKMIAG